jgi:PhzF family phenazine biosynthesis protein
MKNLKATTMTKQRPFKQVDVFTATPYLGNPLAVVLDGSGLSDDEMQHFANWTNLSETTYLLPPTAEAAAQGAHYRVRIFTPGAELPFAGHPTLGSCHAWLQWQTPDFVAPQELVQECAKGLIRIRKDGTRLAFAAPSMSRSIPEPGLLAKVIGALGLQVDQVLGAQLLDNGPVWLVLLLDSAQTVLQIKPDHTALKFLEKKVGVAHVDTASEAPELITRSNREARAFGTRTPGHPEATERSQVTVRGFAAPVGVNEDPVTGSLNASLAQWLIADGLAPSQYIATQGTCLGRFGQVHISQDAVGQVWVGGNVVTCVDGQLVL